MTLHQNIKRVTFKRPFRLAGFVELLPAGTYQIESVGDMLDGMPLPDALQTLAMLHMHSKAGTPGLDLTAPVHLNDIEEAHERDGICDRNSSGDTDDHAQPHFISKAKAERVDRQAIERAENEGMTILPRALH